MTLKEFVNFLNDENLIEIDNIADDDDTGFNNRLRIQKYVFISKYFGLELSYVFNMHLRGPYSKDLSQDYYKLDAVNDGNPNIFDSFNKEDFLRLVKGRSDEWLELAATILQKKGTVNDNVLLDNVAWGKPDFTGKQIEKTYDDLQCNNLLNLHQ